MKSSQDTVNSNLNFDEDSLKGDYSNVALLVLLYMMQGVISGIGYALPLILLNKGNTYEDQAIFSLANYPFTGECGVVGELDTRQFVADDRQHISCVKIPSMINVRLGGDPKKKFIVSEKVFPLRFFLRKNMKTFPRVFPLFLSLLGVFVCLLYWIIAQKKRRKTREPKEKSFSHLVVCFSEAVVGANCRFNLYQVLWSAENVAFVFPAIDWWFHASSVLSH